jgi:hypothetical protein
MSHHDSPVSKESSVLLDEIKRVFGKVQRGSGVTLHETSVIDANGSNEEREQARRKDTDCYWWEVRDDWIERNVGLTFFDDAGLRYYLPAYMCYFLRTGKEPWGLEFQLEKHDRIDQLFSVAEKTLIARFLDHVRYQFEGLAPGETLDPFWRRYLDGVLHDSEEQ